MSISITTQHSDAWQAFENSDYAKRTVASMKREANASEPGPLASNSWQKGNGEVPINPNGAKGTTSKTSVKFHNINEVQKEIHDVAKSAPTGRLAATLVRMVKIAEAWENSGDARLTPYVAELDGIIESAMQEHTASSKKRLKKAQATPEELNSEELTSEELTSSQNDSSSELNTEVGSPETLFSGIYRISFSDDGTVAVDAVSVGRTYGVPGVETQGAVALLSQSGDEENCSDLVAIGEDSDLNTIINDYMTLTKCSDAEGLRGKLRDAFKKASTQI